MWPSYCLLCAPLCLCWASYIEVSGQGVASVRLCLEVTLVVLLDDALLDGLVPGGGRTEGPGDREVVHQDEVVVLLGVRPQVLDVGDDFRVVVSAVDPDEVTLVVGVFAGELGDGLLGVSPGDAVPAGEGLVDVSGHLGGVGVVPGVKRVYAGVSIAGQPHQGAVPRVKTHLTHVVYEPRAVDEV